MSKQLFRKRIGRRTFLGATAAGAALAGGLVPTTASAAAKTVKIGFLAPLTGEVAAWGLPGLYGCEIWAERVNAAGGVQIGDDTYTFEFVSYDNEYAPDKARTGATQLIFEDEVKFIMMLGGDTWPAVLPIANKSGMLVSDPAAERLVAGFHHPDRALRGAPHLQRHRGVVARGTDARAEERRDLRAGRRPRPALGGHVPRGLRGARDRRPGHHLLRHLDHRLRAGDDVDALEEPGRPVSRHLLCRLRASPVRAGVPAGLQGQDHLPAPRTSTSRSWRRPSKEFMEGFIFQFPDFDDPALAAEGINFDASGRVLRRVQQALAR